MAKLAQSVLETRQDQAFPVLSAGDIDRFKRFGVPRHYQAGAAVKCVGQQAEGLLVIPFRRGACHGA